MDNYVAPLPADSVAPDFTLRQAFGLTVSLHRLRGRPVILAFYPAAFEPVSREQLMLYQAFLPQFESLRARILGISADHVWCQEAFAQAMGIRFPLLADTPPRAVVSQLYGVYREPEDLTSRALFVIDSLGVIRFREVHPDSLNPGVDDLLTVLEGLNADVV